MERINYLKLIGGVIAIIIGICLFIIVLKKPLNTAEDTNNYNLQGIISSILAVILGLTLVFNSF